MNGQYEREEMLAVTWNCSGAANQNHSHPISARMVMTERRVLIINKASVGEAVGEREPSYCQ